MAWCWTSRQVMTVEGFLVTCAEDVVGEGATLKPALDKLNGVLATLDNRKAEIQQSIKGLNSYAMSFGEVLSGGPLVTSRGVV